MKFNKINLPATTLQSFEAKIPLMVESIEECVKVKNSAIYRITFKGLEPKGYIVSAEPSVKQASFIHYCDKNEAGSSCTHLALGIAIANKLGYGCNKVNMKSKISDLDTKPFSEFTDEDYISLNKDFGLLEPVKEDEPSAAPIKTPASTSPAPSTPLATSRDWKKGWNEIQDYLVTESIPIPQISKIQAKRADIHSTVSLQPMMLEPEKPNFPYTGEMLGRALRHILLGKDLVLIGGKGTGKDTLIKTLSWILGLPMSIFVGSKDETKESIVGEPAFRNGESCFDKSQFTKLVEHGGIANVAEVNMMFGDVTSIYHPLLDENKVLASAVGNIPRHGQFLFIGTANVGEGYASAKEMNDAFKDRFAVLDMPEVLNFKLMLESKTGLTDTYALSFLEKVKQAVSKLISEESQGQSADTIRGYIDAAHYLKEYGCDTDTKKEVIEDYVLNKIENLDEQMAARDMIRQYAWKDFPISKKEEVYQKGGM